ncbi:MAG: glycosyltransferase [Desulfobacterales bacterium]|nr:glycosyltransferase [Desulfobacterales bacterium]
MEATRWFFLATKSETEIGKTIVPNEIIHTQGELDIVSIVLPVFNNLPYTKKCLQALLKNTTKDAYEIIVVNDASTDGTRDYIESLGGAMRVLNNSENAGFTMACNKGARIARGKYVLS